MMALASWPGEELPPPALRDDPPGRHAHIIDVHEHLVACADAFELVAALDAASIDQAVVLAGPPPSDAARGEPFDEAVANNEAVLCAAALFPGRLLPFVTLLPQAAGNTERLRGYLERGARGLKLYSGHGRLYDPVHPVDDPALDGALDLLEQAHLPLLVHVNAPAHADELERLLNRHPGLKAICPHFCLASGDLGLLERLLEAHPNLFTDVSFGAPAFLEQGSALLASQGTEARDLVERHPDRFLFGTDAVVGPELHPGALALLVEDYLDLLAEARFDPFDDVPPRAGLALPPARVDAILGDNASAVLGSAATPPASGRAPPRAWSPPGSR
jgi:predicted TIM-barrel fold metal-dependent hydrolase